MRFYLVSYDLRKPDYDYQPLYDELEKLGANRVQESVWMLCSNRMALDIHSALWGQMDSTRDRLLVIEVRHHFSSRNAITKIKPLSDACE